MLPEVLEAMLPFFTTEWGNPSSNHNFGAKAKNAIDVSREQVAALINARPQEIIFTSGATESNNTAINAALKTNPLKRHVIISAVEHSSIINYCKALEENGYKVTYLDVDELGLLSILDIEKALSNETAVVSLMWANNETGVLSPVETIAELCKSRGVLYHCDAVQAIGKLPVDVSDLKADYVSFSGHKIGAPKGIGALYVRNKSPFVPLIYGGGQENSRRGGTENIPYIVGFGKATSLALANLSNYAKLVQPLRNRLEKEISTSISNVKINGHATKRLSNTTNIRICGLDNSAVLVMLYRFGIYASSGSACMGSAISPSHVISAMTKSHKHAEESIRFSLCAANTIDEVNDVVARLKEIVQLLL